LSLSVFDEPLKPAPLRIDHTLITSPAFTANETRPDISESLTWQDYGTGEYQEWVPDFGSKTLFFRIIIAYRGPFTDGHETAACWRYDASTGRFEGNYGGEEYNYEK
jgi:hypothetical protein